MANTLTAGLAYNPYFYAQAALEVLYKRLGLAFYVDRSLERDKASAKGDTIQLRRPQTFTATSMPISEASISDVAPDYSNLVINQWQGNGFKLTDKERALTPEQFAKEHVTPVAAAIADLIDQNLASLSLECPWIVAADGTTPPNDFPKVRQTLFNNKAPLVNPDDYAYMTDGVLQFRYEQQPNFYQVMSAGNDNLQRAGVLGIKFGFVVFANQNATTYTTGTGVLTSPVATGVQAKGATSLIIGGSSGSGTWKRGTVFTITGFSQLYAATADTAVGGTGATVPISPPLQLATAGGEVISINQTTATSIGLAFHRRAFALVMQPLEELNAGDALQMATVQDPITGLSLRFRTWYSGGGAAQFWTVDALWGYKTLNPNLAVRVQI